MLIAFNRRSTLPSKRQLDPRPDPHDCAADLDLDRRRAGTAGLPPPPERSRARRAGPDLALAAADRSELPPPAVELVAMQPVAQRDLACHRPRRLALRNNRRLLRIAPAPPPRRPSQNLHPAETVPINWQITWHTIPLPRSNEAASPHRHRPAQGGGQAPLTVYRTC